MIDTNPISKPEDITGINLNGNFEIEDNTQNLFKKASTQTNEMSRVVMDYKCTNGLAGKQGSTLWASKKILKLQEGTE